MKAGKAGKKTIEMITLSMTMLNKNASELMIKYKIKAATDITGFGLIGHSHQMAINSKVSFHFQTSKIPYFAEARKFAQMGLCPGGLHRNREYYRNMVHFSQNISDYINDIVFDPQTSGGLLISISAQKSRRFLKELKQSGATRAAVIGEVISKSKSVIYLD
jgi:selenide,water dikinase